MRSCGLYPVAGAGSHEFKWEWRSEDCRRRSGKHFDYFHDCMEDARNNGFRVLLPEPTGATAPAYFAVTS
jgi:hypothetical protein